MTFYWREEEKMGSSNLDSRTSEISSEFYAKTVATTIEFNVSATQRVETKEMGQYLIVKPLEVKRIQIPAALEKEFEMWEAATDYDLANFNLE